MTFWNSVQKDLLLQNINNLEDFSDEIIRLL